MYGITDNMNYFRTKSREKNQLRSRHAFKWVYYYGLDGKISIGPPDLGRKFSIGPSGLFGKVYIGCLAWV